MLGYRGTASLGCCHLRLILAGLQRGLQCPKTSALFWRVISVSNVAHLPNFVRNLRSALKLTSKQAVAWFASHDYINRIAAEPTWSNITANLDLNYAAILMPPGGNTEIAYRFSGAPLVTARTHKQHLRDVPQLPWPHHLRHACANQQQALSLPANRLTRLPELSTIFEVHTSSLFLIARPGKPSAPPDIFAAVIFLENGEELGEVKIFPTESKSILRMALYQIAGNAKPDLESSNEHDVIDRRLSQRPIIYRGQGRPMYTTDCKCHELQESYSTAQRWALRPTWEVLRCLVAVFI